MDWKTTIHWNVVLAIFQHNHMSRLLETYQIKFWVFGYSPIQGQGPDSCWKYVTDFSCSSPSFFILFPGFGNNLTFKCRSCIFPAILTYMIMLENCQNNILVYGWSQIQGTKFYSWMKSGSKSGTYLSLFYLCESGNVDKEIL